MKGIVFDIQRFALHDGPGVRTVVFLKGCIFRCAWCCNPESQIKAPQLSYNADKCTNCKECIPICDQKVFSSFFWKLNVDFDRCTACGKCIEACSSQALKIYGKEWESSDIMAEVMKDLPYYKNSSGGVTFSGGDPLFQFDFLVDLLQKAKKAGINTCIESEGNGTVIQFEKLLPLVDHFYYDYKITDPTDHLKYIKQGNKTLMENLHFLCTHGADIILRCIIVPGINNNADHFKAIATLGKKYKSIRRIEVFGYHDFGAFKYKQLGMPYSLKHLPAAKPEQVDKWIHEIKRYGYNNIVKG